MLYKNNDPFYHTTIRNTFLAFGALFSRIKFERMNDGVVEQTIRVPIAASSKQKWMQSIEQNPDGTRGIYGNFPRMGYELLGYQYDSTRKLNRGQQVYCTEGDTRTSIGTPVPYNLDLALYITTTNIQDSWQILEQILPAFAPEKTLRIKTINALNVVQEVPFILNSVSPQDDFEGDLETRRFVTHTLNFTAKINLFSGMSDIGLIKQVEVNVSTKDIDNPEIIYVASQDTPVSPIEESWTEVE